jgi:hypothetical protein
VTNIAAIMEKDGSTCFQRNFAQVSSRSANKRLQPKAHLDHRVPVMPNVMLPRASHHGGFHKCQLLVDPGRTELIYIIETSAPTVSTGATKSDQTEPKLRKSPKLGNKAARAAKLEASNAKSRESAFESLQIRPVSSFFSSGLPMHLLSSPGRTPGLGITIQEGTPLESHDFTQGTSSYSLSVSSNSTAPYPFPLHQHQTNHCLCPTRVAPSVLRHLYPHWAPLALRPPLVLMHNS